jgi:hypothetical protein
VQSSLPSEGRRSFEKEEDALVDDLALIQAKLQVLQLVSIRASFDDEVVRVEVVLGC